MQSEGEAALRKGTPRGEITRQYGKASWSAMEDQIVCYEGEVDQGDAFSMGNLMITVVGGVLSQGYAGGPDVTYKLKNYSRALLYFDDADQLQKIAVHSEIENPFLTKVTHFLDFCSDIEILENGLSRSSLSEAISAEPSWASSDQSLLFYGSIREESGYADGVFVSFDDQGRYVAQRTHRFGRFAKNKTFLNNLDDYMSEEWAKITSLDSE